MQRKEGNDILFLKNSLREEKKEKAKKLNQVRWIRE